MSCSPWKIATQSAAMQRGLVCPATACSSNVAFPILRPSAHQAVCVQSMDVAAVLRRLPHDLQQCREVSFALQAHTAATQHDGLAFLGLHAEGTWVQKAIMQPRMQRVRFLLPNSALCRHPARAVYRRSWHGLKVWTHVSAER